MKRSGFIIACLVFILNGIVFAANGVLPGSGTESNPYLIEDLTDFDKFCDEANAGTYWAEGVYTKLMCNIDLVDRVYNSSIINGSYSGYFDGNSNAINKLTITGNNYCGLINTLKGTVSNLSITDINISATGSYIAPIAANIDHGNIINCGTTGEITGIDFTGGIAGNSSYGKIESCYSACKINGQNNVGGVVGKSFSGNINNCYSIGNITGFEKVAGITGYNQYGTVEYCYSTGKIKGQSITGGVIAKNISENVVGCFSYIYSCPSNGIGSLLSDEELATKEVFDGFDFYGISTDGEQDKWIIENGYMPRLFWQNSPGHLPPFLTKKIATSLEGTGTYNTPFLIDNYNDFMEFLNNNELRIGYYQLNDNIDLSNIEFANSLISEPFLGYFNGNKHILSNLTIIGENNIGLFRSIYGNIKDLGLENVNINGTDSIGSLACYNYGNVSGCYFYGEIIGSSYIGGLVSHNQGSIDNCFADGTINGSYIVGGLVGINFHGQIANCFSNCYIDNNNYINGGIVCRFDSGNMQNCFSIQNTIVSSISTDIVSNIEYCFWDSGISGLISGDCGTPKTTAEMQNINTFVNAGWDFSEEDGDVADWQIKEGYYPSLAWGVTVSNVIGMTEEEAEIELSASGLYVGNISYVHNEQIPPGIIISQNVSHGKIKYENTPLSIVVSLGYLLTGTGEKGNPFLISSYEDFQEFCINTAYWDESVYTKLMCDLDLDPALPGREVYALAPIAGGPFRFERGLLLGGKPYYGHFDGNGHIIRNLRISGNNKCYGLFGFAEAGSSISNLGVEDVNIICQYNYAGGLLAVSHAIVTNCYSTGIVTGDQVVGGLVGEHGLYDYDNYENTLNNPGRIIDCYSTCTVNGNYYAGGLVGVNRIPIIRSYSEGEVIGKRLVGGLAALNQDGYIKDSYSTCKVISTTTDSSYIGGLIGASDGRNNGEFINGYVHGSVVNSYYAGNISSDGTSYIGGLVGEDRSDLFKNCFWDIESSGILDMESGMNDTDGMIGLDNFGMWKQDTYNDAGWDFINESSNGTEDVWHMPNGTIGYPMLWWQKDIAGDIAGKYGVDMEDFALLADKWLDGYSLADLEQMAEHWIMNSEPMSPPTLGLHMKMDEDSGNISSDSSVYGRNGTIYGGPIPDTGMVDGCLVFDGVDDYIELNSYCGIAGSNPRTVSAWIKADEDLENVEQVIHVIAFWGNKATGQMWQVLIDDQSGKLAVAIIGARIKGGPDLEDGLWHHIAAVLPDEASNINQVRMFVDGTEISTNAEDLDMRINTATIEHVLIGALDSNSQAGIQTPTGFFDGAIDDVRIYNEALSDQQIAEMAGN